MTETAYAATGQTQPLTRRYVYDAGNKNLLKFVLTAEGRVTEYRYDATGLRVAAIEYRGGVYDVSGLAATAAPTEAQLTAWVGTQDLTRTDRTDYGYLRGQLQTVTTYASVDASGAGVAAGKSTTQYVYNQRGELLQTITPDTRGVTQTVYDGLGRVVWAQARSSDGTLTTTTTTLYDDANGKATITLANGLSTTSTYDKAGRLVSVVDSASGQPNLGTTRYANDADGQLVMVEDPTGQRGFVLYDAAGRKVGEVSAAGALTEYVYDATGLLTEVIGYATAVDRTKLVDGSGNPHLLERFMRLVPVHSDRRPFLQSGAGDGRRAGGDAGASAHVLLPPRRTKARSARESVIARLSFRAATPQRASAFHREQNTIGNDQW